MHPHTTPHGSNLCEEIAGYLHAEHTIGSVTADHRRAVVDFLLTHPVYRAQLHTPFGASFARHARDLAQNESR